MSFTSIHKIRFDDVDGAGIVYYPHYFHLCHQALEDFFDTAAPFSYPEMIRDRRLGLPTVAIESTFTGPLVYGDTAIVSMTVEHIGKSSLVLAYKIHRKADGAECFTARITTVLISLDTRKSTPLTKELRTVFEGLADYQSPVRS